MRSKKLNRQKDAKNEAEYEEFLLSCFNIFKCGKDILNRLDMTYERACMAIQENE